MQGRAASQGMVFSDFTLEQGQGLAVPAAHPHPSKVVVPPPPPPSLGTESYRNNSMIYCNSYALYLRAIFLYV